MPINSDIYNELNSKLYNQDNNGVWINPIVQKPIFKFYILFVYIFVSVPLLKDFNINNINKIQITFYVAHLLIALIAIIFFITNKIKTKIFIKNKEDKEKLLNEINFEYYREILDEFSPGVLAFCYNKNLEYEDIIISTLLSFKDKYINLDITNKNISILPEKNYNNLKEYEKYLLENIKDISNNVTFQELKKIITDTYFKSNFLNLIKQDCKNSSYFKTIYRKNKLLACTFFIFLFVLFISALVCNIQFYGDILLAGFINMGLLIILMFLDRKNSYMMTNRGYEINMKLNGLKKYLLDYSTINNRNINEISIWDYYIIYAIILDLKGKLDKEVSEFYKDIS